MFSLPRGLALCGDCGQARGTTPRGATSVCLCAAIHCGICGLTLPRPGTERYDLATQTWEHVPSSVTRGHACTLDFDEEVRRVQ